MMAALKAIDIHRPLAASVVFQLAAAFGHAKDSKQMSRDVLINGPNGLPYFYDHVVCKVLDQLEHPEYDAVLEAIVLCCTALMRKALSYVKVLFPSHETRSSLTVCSFSRGASPPEVRDTEIC